MKDSNHKSKNHSKNDKSEKRHNGREESTDKYHNVLKERHYRDDLEYDRNGKNHNSNSAKHHSDSSKEKHRSSEHKSRHNHPKSVISSAKKEDKKHKRSAHRIKEVEDESYEELSRKKRKIESELHALDLEEAAAKEAASKKAQRQSSDVNKRKSEPARVREEPVRVREEPVRVREEPVRVREEPVRVREEPVRVREEPVRVREEPVRVREEPVRVKEEPVRVKEEPVSDDDRNKRSKDKTKNKLVPNDNKNKKSKPQSSKSSGDDEKWGSSSAETKKPEKPKEKPNFAVSGKLAEDTNMYNGVVIKYNEPAEARKPKKRWRLYPFKGDTNLPFIPIHRQSAYLFGRTRSIADIPIDHPSCSKQHAVLQFRLVTYKREDGTTGRRVRPYIIDLESSNGTFVNNKKVDPRCYVELIEKDIVKFGFSSREYVLLHEESQFDEEDEDVILESD